MQVMSDYCSPIQTKVVNTICHWHPIRLAQNLNTRNDLGSVFHQTLIFDKGVGGVRPWGMCYKQYQCCMYSKWVKVLLMIWHFKVYSVKQSLKGGGKHHWNRWVRWYIIFFYFVLVLTKVINACSMCKFLWVSWITVVVHSRAHKGVGVAHKILVG